MINNKPSIYNAQSVYNQGGSPVEHSVELGEPPNNVFYGTQKIGPLYWTTENLDLDLGWASGCANTTNPVAGYYDNDINYNYKHKRFGLLYNWYGAKAVNDYLISIESKWRVPTTDDVQKLIEYIGGGEQCNKLKTDYNWVYSSGTNDFGFSAYGSGFYESAFYSVLNINYLWTMTQVDAVYAKSFQISNTINCEIQMDKKLRCYSIRLCCDA